MNPHSDLARLPPLGALRAFVVAAEHASFARAAAALNVTPAAVGQQIRMLEDLLGVPLFDRTTRQLALTDAGRALLPGLAAGFGEITGALQRLNGIGEAPPLTVSVAPSFAVKWLIPRIELFALAAPDIDLRISAAMTLTSFGSDGVDCAIRYGAGRYAGLHAEKVLSESVLPVAAPGLVARMDLREPADLARITLLHDASADRDASCPDWGMWLKAAGVAHAEARRGPQFDQSSLVLEAAALGRGVALAKARLAERDLAQGRLVRLFDLSQPLAFAYWFVCPPERLALPRVARFRDWLLGQAAEDEAQSIEATAGGETLVSV